MRSRTTVQTLCFLRPRPPRGIIHARPQIDWNRLMERRNMSLPNATPHSGYDTRLVVPLYNQ
ncbi:hypothetical protein DPMN_128246 [Dreissena polymorpha]|uniref:Uncharacterized protein n=1 Tax=Dreissena polymorpha TaxID=45954 RepID=A0A9D4H3I0_DREPO|nr:hypothetical protein DPMN_128246 [Dreissena polymorpha]